MRGRLLGQPFRNGKASVRCRADLRLPEQRRVQHRLAVVRGGARSHAETVVQDKPLAGGMGRTDRPGRRGLAARSASRNGRRRRTLRQSRRARACPRDPASTTTDRARTSARRKFLACRAPVCHRLLRGPSSLLARRRPGEPLPAARTGGSAAAAARIVRSRRVSGVLRPPDLLSGRRSHQEPVLLSATARVLHMESVVNRGIRAAVCGAFIVLWLAPSAAVAQSPPQPSTRRPPRRARRTSGSWPAAPSPPCGPTARPAKKTFRIGTRPASSPTSGTE